ncbi:hypothetical protein TB1_033555 [Malus domestica]
MALPIPAHRPLVRLAQRSKLQHHTTPTRLDRLRPGVEQRHLVLLHIGLHSRVQNCPSRSGYFLTQLGQRSQVAGSDEETEVVLTEERGWRRHRDRSMVNNTRGV